MRRLGIRRVRTTAYHHLANEMIKRLHRQLKAESIAHGSHVTWRQILPLVLLGFRSAFKEDIGYFSAEFLYGEPLLLSGVFVIENTESLC